MLVSEYGNDVVSIYQFDANGNPNPATRSLFIDGFPGVLGAVIDPLTGDCLFSTYRPPNRVVVVRGFSPPGPCVADPTQCSVDRLAPVLATPREGEPLVLPPRD